MHRSASSLLLGALLFASCTSSRVDEQAALAKGEAITTTVFQTLMAHVTSAMEEGGPVHAVEYCSVRALPLVDSLSRVHDVRIKRTSGQLRAKHDRPDAQEEELLEYFRAQVNAGTSVASLEPQVRVKDDSIAYYRPIAIVTPGCLKCHGRQGDDLDVTAFARIKELYPQDQATGYALGDLRGMWSVRWPQRSTL